MNRSLCEHESIRTNADYRAYMERNAASVTSYNLTVAKSLTTTNPVSVGYDVYRDKAALVAQCTNKTVKKPTFF
jgi:hypothetical protein